MLTKVIRFSESLYSIRSIHGIVLHLPTNSFFFLLTLIIINFKRLHIMKKRSIKSLELNKRAISKFNFVGGRPPESHTCAIGDPQGPDEPSHVWFTDDLNQHVCQSFHTNCNVTTN